MAWGHHTVEAGSVTQPGSARSANVNDLNVPVGCRKALQVGGITRQQETSARFNRSGDDVSVDDELRARAGARQYASYQSCKRAIRRTHDEARLARQASVDQRRMISTSVELCQYDSWYDRIAVQADGCTERRSNLSLPGGRRTG